MRRAAPGAALVLAWILTTTVGPTAEAGSDVGLYRGYAQQIGDGLVPYRDFLVEYPPLALVPTVAADALGRGQSAF